MITADHSQQEGIVKSIVNWMFYSKSLLTLLHIDFKETFRLVSLLMSERLESMICQSPSSIFIQIEDYSLIGQYEQHLQQYNRPLNRIILILLQCSYHLTPSQEHQKVIMHFLYD